MHQEIKDRIIHLLEEIVERANAISQHNHAGNELEIDLAMEDTRLLYREFNLLRRLQHNQSVKAPVAVAPEIPAGVQQVEPAPVAAAPVVAPLPQPVIETQVPVIVEQPEPVKIVAPAAETIQEFAAAKEVVVEPVMQNEVKNDIKPEPVVIKTEPVAIKHEPVVIKTEPVVVKNEPVKAPEVPQNGNRQVADLFTQESPRSVGENLAREDNSLHKRIVAQKEDRSIGTRLQMTPVASLKDAIGVNEKFLFINELFGGNIQVYNEAIAKLNSFGNMQEAFDYLNELNDLISWDQNRSGQAIEKLANFVQRRYIDRK